MLPPSTFIALCYGLGVPLLALFAAYALLVSRAAARAAAAGAAVDAESFVTARRSAGLVRLAWSFYCGSVGAWTLCTPPNYASIGGVLGVTAYALACGLPPLLVAAAGARMRRAAREPSSLVDYVATRHGRAASLLATGVALFNMGVVLLAEYVVIGSIFADFVGGAWRVIVVAVALLTILYTAVGGLHASIATDQVQGAASLLAAAVLIAYVAATKAGGLPSPLPPPLAPSPAGGASFFTLGASLLASLAFQEAMWQRVWAARDGAALAGGALAGAALTAGAVFAAGWGGVLAIGGGLVKPGVTNPNLYLFELLAPSADAGAPTPTQPRPWVGVVVVLLALTMNESAVDSLQNGIAASLSGWLTDRPLWATRAAVLAVNVPIAAVALAAPAASVLSLFLVTNLLCCTALPPLALSLLPHGPGAGRGCGRHFGGRGFIGGVAVGALALSALGWARELSFVGGLRWAWYGNDYDWRAFLTALGASAGATLAAAAGSAAWAAWRGEKGAGTPPPAVKPDKLDAGVQ